MDIATPGSTTFRHTGVHRSRHGHAVPLVQIVIPAPSAGNLQICTATVRRSWERASCAPQGRFLSNPQRPCDLDPPPLLAARRCFDASGLWGLGYARKGPNTACLNVADHGARDLAAW